LVTSSCWGNPDSGKPKHNGQVESWDADERGRARTIFLSAFSAFICVQKVFAFCATISLERDYGFIRVSGAGGSAGGSAVGCFPDWSLAGGFEGSSVVGCFPDWSLAGGFEGGSAVGCFPDWSLAGVSGDRPPTPVGVPDAPCAWSLARAPVVLLSFGGRVVVDPVTSL